MADFDKKVALIEIDIDQSAAKKSVEELTGAIISQKGAIKDNTDEIKKLSKGTEEEQKQAKELEKQNFKLRDELKDLNSERASALKATKLQSNSLNALRKTVVNQKKELNGLNTATEQGRKRFDELSKSLKSNNEQIKELDQGAGDFKTSVGDYPELLDNMGGGISGVISGFKGMTSAALKFIATPIGIVLGVIAGAFALVQNAIGRSTESSGKLTRALSPLKGILNLALKALEPLGEFLIDGIVKGFELASKAVSFFTDALADGLDFLGFDGAAESVRTFKEEVVKASDAAVKLAEDEAKLTAELRKQERLQLDFQNRAEKIRQLRDDESRSVQQRVKDNEALGKVLKEQSEAELEIANLALSVVNQRIAMEGENSELLDSRAEALTKIAEINERITSQESEQLSNLNSLRKEQNDLIKEQAAKKAEEAADEAKLIHERQEKTVQNQIALNERLKELEDIRRNDKFESQIKGLEDEREIFALRQEQEEANFQSMLETIEEQENRVAANTDLSSEERAIQQAEIDISREQALIDHKNKLLEITEDSNKKIEDSEEGSEKKKTDISRSGQNAVSGILETTNNKIGGFYEDRIKEVEAQLAAGEINEETAAKKIKKLEKNQAVELWKIDKGRFRAQQLQDIAGVGVDTARAISKSVAASPLTGGLPWSAAAGIIGAAQIAAIATKKSPSRPSFAEGGAVIRGRDHSQGGEDIFVGGRYAGNMQGGEGLYVTKREATARALSFMNEQEGGRSFFGASSRYLQEGGQVNTTQPQGVSRDEIISIMASLPPLEVQAGSVMAGIEAEKKANDLGIV